MENTLPAADDSIDIPQLLHRIRLGLLITTGLGLLGMAFAGSIYLLSTLRGVQSTSARVVFNFAGLERGVYPDQSGFDPDDLRAPEIISEALKRQNLETSINLQNQIRSGLSIEGIIPIAVAKERDRLRAGGQSLRPFVADEYELSLTAPSTFQLSPRQRELLINEIVMVFRDRFRRTYAELPFSFGSAFDALKQADYFEYDLILSKESAHITTFLSELDTHAKTFRSQTTNLSFADLLKQSEYFTKIRLNETLGIIRQNGLSKDRRTALIKMDYYLRTLADEERRALDEEKLVQDLLTKAQERAAGYVLGVKSQAVRQRPEAPMLDQGLIDSLLANDAYNFLVRRALDAGLKVRAITAEKAELMDRRKNMESFSQSSTTAQLSDLAQLEQSKAAMKVAYDELVQSIRATHADYSHQAFGNSVRISLQPKTESPYGGLAIALLLGLGIGTCFGLGISLLRTPAPATPA